MILVVAEQKDGKLNRASWEAVAGAQQLAEAAGSGAGSLTIAVAGQNVGSVAADLASADVSGVLTVDDPALASYTPDAFVQAVRQVIEQTKPQFVVFPHTYQTRDYAPALAAVIDRALVTDVIGVKALNGAAAFARPMFQGKLTADVGPEGPAPHLISFQIGAFRADAVKRGAAAAPVTKAALTID
ncbi:MAG: electron transfer flavoprotein subunit alpha/FixB family protein, partial [Dongiaceae bacterium]